MAARKKPSSIKAKSGQETVIKKESKTLKDLIVVGIGASAGGLEALEEFFRNMPSNSGLSFCVVQHLSPDYKSMMGELLSRHTRMSIFRVEDGTSLEPDSIYLIPPKKNMTIFHNRIFLSDQDHSRGLNLPIDIFLRSLAEDKGKNAIGIILSGTGSDGSLGTRAIKEAGGMVMVQEERTAKFDGMPRSSIATGVVDYILPPAKMPEELIKYIEHPYITKTLKIENVIQQDDSILTKVIKIIKDRVGVDFSFYKPNTIIRRLEKRLSINQIKKIENYISFLTQSPNEAEILYRELLIGVTQFFRDPDAYDLLTKEALPVLLKDKQPGSQIRLWTVGCSTGEEAYSMAILMDEYLRENNLNLTLKIFATDIDKEAIEYAGLGIYPESIISDVKPERLKRYFTRKGKTYQISDNIRQMVVFAKHNIISDPPFTKINMISCRNLLIYLSTQTQRKILSMFYYSILPEGILFLGSSETVGEISKGFDLISNKWKIYKFKHGYRPPMASNFMVPPVSAEKLNINLNRHRNMKTGTTRKTDPIFENLLEEYVPPCLILDDNFEIVHIYKDVNKFIKIQPGKLTLNVLKMVRKELSVVISSMLHKAEKEKKPVYFKDITIKDNADEFLVDINARVFEDKSLDQKYFLLSFIRKEDQPEDKDKLDMKSEYTDQYYELEKELNYTKENLQATIEELETSNEELQSTNEELIASNEELQSTNEELQSVNEELYTVNSEYQNKIEELTQLNNDINNLLKNTNVGTLFLDTDLKIRKYTPIISEVFNIIEIDIGRPIKHINYNFEYKNLISDIINVLDTLEVIENKITGRNGHDYLLRILPYRTMENAVDGIVITLVDITKTIANEEKIKREQNLLIRVLNNSPIAKTMVDVTGKITYANKKATEVLELSKSRLKNKKFNDPKWVIRDMNGNEIPDEDLPFSVIISGKKELNDYRHSIKTNDGRIKYLSICGAPVFDDKNKVIGAVFSLQDITDNIKQERVASQEKELLYRVLDISQEGALITDRDGQIVYSNYEAEKTMKVSRKDIIKRSYNDPKWDIRYANNKKIKEKDLPFKKIMLSKKEIRNYKLKIINELGKDVRLLINGRPLFDSKDNPIGAVFSIKNY